MTLVFTRKLTCDRMYKPWTFCPSHPKVSTCTVSIWKQDYVLQIVWPVRDCDWLSLWTPGHSNPSGKLHVDMFTCDRMYKPWTICSSHPKVSTCTVNIWKQDYVLQIVWPVHDHDWLSLWTPGHSNPSGKLFNTFYLTKINFPWPNKYEQFGDITFRTF